MKARHRMTILGCSASPGVPRIGDDWGKCDPNNPKNRRRRASALIERFADNGERTVVVIDTGPDFREQMLSVGIGWADGIVYTHAHADHIHGIDDLRAFMLNRRKRPDVWCDEVTSGRLHDAFGYCFKMPAGSSYPPIVTEHRIIVGQPIEISGPGGVITLLPINQNHGEINSLGFRIGNIGYSSDISNVPDESVKPLSDLDIWVVDALRHEPHSSHFSVAESLAWAAKLRAKSVILTHMHTDLDYDALSAELPAHAQPAYDGLTFEFRA